MMRHQVVPTYQKEVRMKHKLMFKFLMVTLTFFVTCGLGIAATFDMAGSYLNVGMSNTGGLIDDNYNVGLQFDPTGTGNFTNAPDILKPDTPFEFYAVAINGVDEGPNGFGFNNSNYVMTSTKVGPLVASTAGVVGGLAITVQTTVVSGKEVLFNVDFINFSGAPMNVQYARGLDAKPDYELGSSSTVNSISAGMVTALGPLTGVAISIVDLSGGGVPTIQAPTSGGYGWATSLATLSIPMKAGNYGDSDSSINMYWNLGTIPNLASKDISFAYELSAVTPVPLPPALLLLAPGLFGLVGLRKRFFG
jgi:hypothetical protein